MNKSDLVDALADATGMTKADAAKAVDAMFSPDGGIIATALKGGKRVQITGFGTFERRHRQARSGELLKFDLHTRNPCTRPPGESAQTPAANALRMLTAAELRPVDGTETGQQAKDRSRKTPERCQQEIDWLEYDREALAQVGKVIHLLLAPYSTDRQADLQQTVKEKIAEDTDR